MTNDAKSKYDLVAAFPKYLETSVRHAFGVIPEVSRLSYSELVGLSQLGEMLSIPYRIYYNEPDESEVSSLTVVEQSILFALYTRHHNGYVREKYVKKLVTHAAKQIWITPYLMMLHGEYVEEIIQVIYEHRSFLNADFIKTFIAENLQFYRTTKRRVVSYWDCYHRRKYPKKKEYVGFQLLDYMSRMKGKDLRGTDHKAQLVSWKFDDEVEDDPNEWNWIEITLYFSDGSRRWSILYTPQRLLNNLSRERIDPPGLHISHMIVVRSYSVDDINRVLKDLEENNRLIEASMAY